MERTSMFVKEKSYDTRIKIRKYWIPVVLVILIICNLTIVPNYLSNPIRTNSITHSTIIQSDIKEQTHGIESQGKPIETPIIAQPEPEPEVKSHPEQEGELKPAPKKSHPIAPIATKRKKKNLNEKIHNQNFSFRSSLFFYVLFVVGMMYSLISFKSYSDDNFKSDNSNTSNTNKDYKSQDNDKEKEYSYHEDNEEYDNL